MLLLHIILMYVLLNSTFRGFTFQNTQFISYRSILHAIASNNHMHQLNKAFSQPTPVRVLNTNSDLTAWYITMYIYIYICIIRIPISQLIFMLFTILFVIKKIILHFTLYSVYCEFSKKSLFLVMLFSFAFIKYYINPYKGWISSKYIRIQFVPHRKHIMSPQQIPTG
jgi:hypothetical protein